MTKNIVKIYTALIIVFFSYTHMVHSGFEITEIMYDLDGTDTNREWIEVHNTGNTSTDLSSWYLFSDNTKHALVPQGSSSVPSGGYAVITQNVLNFNNDQPNFSGLLFDSSWTGFNNESETIALKDQDLNIVSEVSFTPSMGGAGNGDSLQKINGSFEGATPTPGSENKSGSGGIKEENSYTEDNIIKEKEVVAAPKMKTKILTKSTVVAGVPLKIGSATEGYEKEAIKIGKFVWNFGDGMAREDNESRSFEYTYTYPGEYVLTLAYHQYYFFSPTPDASDRIIIKVLPREVSISSVGDDRDPFLEIENKSPLEIDLSDWYIKGSTHTFSIPQGTYILPNKKLKFSPRATFFTGEDLKSVTVYNQAGETFAVYPSVVKPLVKAVQYTASPKVSVSNSVNNSKSNISSSDVINLDDLGASAEGSSASIPNSTLAWLGFIAIIVVASISVFFLNRKNSKIKEAKQDLSADDMLIME